MKSCDDIIVKCGAEVNEAMLNQADVMGRFERLSEAVRLLIPYIDNHTCYDSAPYHYRVTAADLRRVRDALPPAQQQPQAVPPPTRHEFRQGEDGAYSPVVPPKPQEYIYYSRNRPFDPETGLLHALDAAVDLVCSHGRSPHQIYTSPVGAMLLRRAVGSQATTMCFCGSPILVRKLYPPGDDLRFIFVDSTNGDTLVVVRDALPPLAGPLSLSEAYAPTRIFSSPPL